MQQEVDGLADEIGDGGVACSGEEAEGLVAVRVEMNLESCLHWSIILQSGIAEKSKRGRASAVSDVLVRRRTGEVRGSFIGVKGTSCG